MYTVKRDKGGISHSGKKRELRTSPEKKLRLFAENIAGQKVHALFAVSDRKRSPATIPKVGRFDVQKELVERGGKWVNWFCSSGSGTPSLLSSSCDGEVSNPIISPERRREGKERALVKGTKQGE